jgi:endoglucanase
LGVAFVLCFSATAFADTTVEAEKFTMDDSGSAIRTGVTASGSSDVAHWGRGARIATSSQYKYQGSISGLTLTERGHQCKGAPLANVYVDGTQVAQFSVRATSYTDYSTAALNIPAADHVIKIEFPNDYKTKKCDRNLFDDKVLIKGTAELSSANAACADGTDNDSDGKTDYPDDPGCTDANDNDETDPPVTSPSSNPFAGEKLWVDPNHEATVTANQWRTSRPSDAAYLDKIGQSAASPYYLEEWTEDPTCCDGVAFYTDLQIQKVKNAGALPVIGVYAIPNRDCGSYSSGGFPDSASYRAWIDKMASGVQGRKTIFILEPDGLASSCFTSARAADLKYATYKLTDAGGYVYIDAGHSKWQTPATIISRLQASGIEKAAGFVSNNANFNLTSDEAAWGKQVSDGVGGKHQIIDTGRNGLGPYTGGTHDGNCPEWANPPGRALGAKPTASTGYDWVDAFFWAKQPGDSDADCGPFPRAGAWTPDMDDAKYGSATYDTLGLAKRASQSF